MLSERLKLIASFVPKNSNCADIGSDHGYLLTYLKRCGFDGKLLGVENKKGPFLTLKENISNSNFADLIQVSFSDGLDEVGPDFDTIVIAGMGEDSIKEIVTRNPEKLDNINCFVIDSHTKTPLIRHLFNDLGYKIDDEKMIEEDDIYYEVIRFVKGKAKYSDLDFEFGPILRKVKDDVFVERYTNMLYRLENIVKMINHDDPQYEKISKRIKDIKEIL